MKKVIPLLVAICALILPVHGQAQTWPTRPVRLIVPYSAGGNSDIVARIVANALQADLHVPFVVENKAGAGGIIGSMAVVRAAPDGYTLLFSADGPILFAPELAPQRPYEWDKVFTPVSLVSLTPLVVVVNPKLPVQTFKEFVDYAQNEGDKLIFANSGLGGINQIFSEYMRTKLQLKWTAVPYKGTAPALADLMAGQAQFSVDQVSSAAPFIAQGAVRALGMTSEHRMAVLPDVPTLVELGYKDLIGNTFTAMMAPAGTPKDVVTKLHAALVEAAKDPKFRENIQRLPAEVTMMTPQDSEVFLESESATWAPIVRKLNPASH